MGLLASRRPPFPRLALVCGFLVGCLIAGCATSPQRRYEILSFFFDGVPTPEERAAAKAAAEAAQAEKEGRTVAGRGSRHQPVVQRRCGVCHGLSERDAELRSYSGIDWSNIERAWRVCRSCHADDRAVGRDALIFRKDVWLHGPVGLGLCRSCHTGHRSEFPALLRHETQEETCRGCHEALGERTGSMAALDCVACHDPHSAAKASDLFLRGGAAESCAQCHLLDRERLPWIHGPVAVGTCATCHSAHGGEGTVNHVRRPIRPVCLSCHEAADLSQVAHPPEAAAEECDACHVSHAAHSAKDLFLRDRIAAAGGPESAFVKPEPESVEAPPSASGSAPR
jgi:predicted CXXCH cytochrome family protein